MPPGELHEAPSSAVEIGAARARLAARGGVVELAASIIGGLLCFIALVLGLLLLEYELKKDPSFPDEVGRGRTAHFGATGHAHRHREKKPEKEYTFREHVIKRLQPLLGGRRRHVHHSR